MSTRCTVSIFNAPCLIEVHYVDMRRPLPKWYPSWRHQCNLPIWGEQMPIRNEKRCMSFKRALVEKDRPVYRLIWGWRNQMWCADLKWKGVDSACKMVYYLVSHEPTFCSLQKSFASVVKTNFSYFNESGHRRAVVLIVPDPCKQKQTYFKLQHYT